MFTNEIRGSILFGCIIGRLSFMFVSIKDFSTPKFSLALKIMSSLVEQWTCYMMYLYCTIVSGRMWDVQSDDQDRVSGILTPGCGPCQAGLVGMVGMCGWFWKIVSAWRAARTAKAASVARAGRFGRFKRFQKARFDWCH